MSLRVKFDKVFKEKTQETSITTKFGKSPELPHHFICYKIKGKELYSSVFLIVLHLPSKDDFFFTKPSLLQKGSQMENPEDSSSNLNLMKFL